ncbi:MAG: alpha/beta hydrolase [Flavobacteriaceae bacterium]|nr:alpha/beta hydrolase [Flavobacteriaceae bacterium]
MEKYIIKLVGTYLNVLSMFSADYAANKALHIFSKPRKGKLKPNHEAFLSSANQSVLYYEELPIQVYHWKGEKETILLAHGWESNAARWKNKINLFINEGFNVVALDGPAHGKSGSKVFNALLYSEFINVVARKCKPQVIIGHSVGGMASVFFQQKYQLKHIQKMVLLGAPSEFSGVLKNYVELLGYNSKIEKQLHNVIFDKFGAHPEAFSTSKFIKDIETEGLIIHDQKDSIIPFSDAKLIEKNFKNSKLISTTGLGHSLNHKSVSKNVLEFIKG